MPFGRSKIVHQWSLGLGGCTCDWSRSSTAVDSVDLKVDCGTFYGFLGPNGAGKSTTIKMLTGLLGPIKGTISVLGCNMLDPARSLEVKRHIGVIPENLVLFDNLTAIEYLVFIGRIYGLARATIRQRSDAIIFDRILHLPVAFSQAFALNYLSTLMSMTLLSLCAFCLGFTFGSCLSIGPIALLFLIPFAVFLVAITALTYQLQGWRAALSRSCPELYMSSGSPVRWRSWVLFR